MKFSNYKKLLTICVLLGIFSNVAGIHKLQYHLSPLVQVYNLHMNRIVLEHKHYIQVVAFIDLVCGVCYIFLNIWNALAIHIQDINVYVKVALVDCTYEKSQCFDSNVAKVPSLRYFPPNSPMNYTGTDIPVGADLKSTFHFVMQPILQAVRTHAIVIPYHLLEAIRTKRLVEPEKNSIFMSPRPVPFNPCDETQLKRFPFHSRVVHVGKTNINMVIPNPNPVLLGFYDVHCRPCGKFVDIWEQLSQRFSSGGHHVVFAAIDCGVNPELCDTHQIDYYPAMMFIPPGSQHGPMIMAHMSYPDVEHALHKQVFG